MDYFPLEITAPQTMIICNNKLYFGNKWDYFIVFTMWFCYIFLSILFFLTVNNFVIDSYSLGLGIFSYFLSLPGIYYAIACFSTDPGIIKRGDLNQPENIENDNPHPNVQDNGIIDYHQKETVEEMKDVNKSSPQENNFQQEIIAQNNKILLNGEEESNREVDTQQQQQQKNDSQHLQMQELAAQPDQQVTQKSNRGNLLKERYCKTCKIMRPPLASHCSHCNNCVKTFDHHCYFMGNCIGERNQKHFVLFLIFTAIWSIYVEIFTFLNTIEAIEVNDQLVYDIIFNQYLSYPFCILAALSVISVMLRCHQCIKGWLFLAFIGDAIVITLYSYIQNRDIPLSDNPIISIVMCGIYIGVILFVTPQACFNTNLACRSLTQKQDSFFHTYTHEHQYQFSFSNFWKLITKPQIQSEIIS